MILLAPVLGWIKVEQQRRSPPDWANKPIHMHEGYVSIDGHARRAATARDVLLGEEAAAATLADDLRTGLHPHSIVVPFVVGALAVAVGSIAVAHLVYNVVVYGITLVLIAYLANVLCKDRQPDSGSAGMQWSVWLFASHVSVHRDAMQLHLDATVACLAVAALAIALSFRASAGGPTAGLLAGCIHSLGVFTKASFLPFMVAMPVAAMAKRSDARAWATVGVSLAFPAVLLAIYGTWLGDSEATSRDLQHFAASWNVDAGHLRRFALELGLALQWFPIVIVVVLRTGNAMERATLAVVGAYLVALLSFGLPSVPRLYLPAIAVLCALSAPIVVAHAARGRAWQLYAWAVGNVLAATAGLSPA